LPKAQTQRYNGVDNLLGDHMEMANSEVTFINPLLNMP
jgi:hypothetical protein